MSSSASKTKSTDSIPASKDIRNFFGGGSAKKSESTKSPAKSSADPSSSPAKSSNPFSSDSHSSRPSVPSSSGPAELDEFGMPIVNPNEEDENWMYLKGKKPPKPREKASGTAKPRKRSAPKKVSMDGEESVEILGDSSEEEKTKAKPKPKAANKSQSAAVQAPAPVPKAPKDATKSPYFQLQADSEDSDFETEAQRIERREREFDLQKAKEKEKFKPKEKEKTTKEAEKKSSEASKSSLSSSSVSADLNRKRKTITLDDDDDEVQEIVKGGESNAPNQSLPLPAPSAGPLPKPAKDEVLRRLDAPLIADRPQEPKKKVARVAVIDDIQPLATPFVPQTLKDSSLAGSSASPIDLSKATKGKRVEIDATSFFTGGASAVVKKQQEEEEALRRKIEEERKRKEEEKKAAEAEAVKREEKEKKAKEFANLMAKQHNPAEYERMQAAQEADRKKKEEEEKARKAAELQRAARLMDEGDLGMEDSEVEELPNKSPAKTPKQPEKKRSAPSSAAKDGDAEEGEQKKKKSYWEMKKEMEARGPPPMKGQKPLPEGKPNCLEGLTFVLSGVLDSLERDDASDLIKKYGGRVTSAISGKTSYLVMGQSGGETKAKAAKEKGVKVIDEDGLFALISSRGPGAAAAQSAASSSPASAQKKPTGLAAKAAQLSAVPAGAPKTASQAALQDQLLSHNRQKAHSLEEMLWVDKHRPMKRSEIIGNNANVARIEAFLDNWEKLFGPGGKPGRDQYRAILLSGGPGIGKTTAATLIAKEKGYDVIELNASETRNKSSLEQTVGELLGSRGLGEFFTGSKATGPSSSAPRKKLLIMDEVDGMAGNEDRGGMAELIQLIKKTKTPIICICNDASSPKMRSLKNYVETLQWRRTPSAQISHRILAIARSEGLNIDQPTVEKLAESTQGDIRQMLNWLQMWSKTSKSLSFDQLKKKMETSGKDFESGVFEVVPELFKSATGKNWIDDRNNIYFVDAQIIPLFVQENYLQSKARINLFPHAQPAVSELLAVSAAADLISDGDLINESMRVDQDYDFMPAHGVISTVYPAYLMGAAGVGGRVNFPAWLGKNSNAMKQLRQLRELKVALSLDVHADLQSLALEYLPILRSRLTEPLLSKGPDGIGDVIDLLDQYGLTRDDWDYVMELTDLFAGKKIELETKTKAAFTRKYNSTGHHLKVARTKQAGADITRGKAPKLDQEGLELDDEPDEEEKEEDEDDIKNDKMIKVTEEKKSKAGTTAAAAKGKAKGKAKKELPSDDEL